MKNILVPTDFSDNAWNALRYGLELFKNTKCTFYLMHVNPIPPYSGAGTSVRAASDNFKETVLKESRAQLKKLLNEIEKLPLNTEHTYIPLAFYDFFTDAVKRESVNKKVDLIIMGTKGASGLKKATIGSNTGDVMTKVKCPLLAVPENTVLKKPQEIAFPTDYHTGYSADILNFIVEMTTMNNASLRVLHVNKRDEELGKEQVKNKRFLDQYLKNTEHSFHTMSQVKLETAVECFIQSRDIGMIAMIAKNLNFLQRILFRPTVEKISYHTNIPFLVLHEQ